MHRGTEHTCSRTCAHTPTLLSTCTPALQTCTPTHAPPLPTRSYTCTHMCVPVHSCVRAHMPLPRHTHTCPCTPTPRVPHALAHGGTVAGQARMRCSARGPGTWLAFVYDTNKQSDNRPSSLRVPTRLSLQSGGRRAGRGQSREHLGEHSSQGSCTPPTFKRKSYGQMLCLSLDCFFRLHPRAQPGKLFPHEEGPTPAASLLSRLSPTLLPAFPVH